VPFKHAAKADDSRGRVGMLFVPAQELPISVVVVTYAEKRLLILEDATACKGDRAIRLGERPGAAFKVMDMIGHAVV
jgi:hypothetical protein